MDRVFLDANVLYSAAYTEPSGLARLWTLKDTELLTSVYAIEETRRNLLADRPHTIRRFQLLIANVSIIDAPPGLELPVNIQLDSKDQPILLSAIYGKADFLLTVDVKHFGRLFGKRVEGVVPLRPSQYFGRRGGA